VGVVVGVNNVSSKATAMMYCICGNPNPVGMSYPTPVEYVIWLLGPSPTLSLWSVVD